METLPLSQWLTVGLSIALFISEVLPFTKKVKSNGLFQAVISILKAIKGKK